jgi:hypothetical protein
LPACRGIFMPRHLDRGAPLGERPGGVARPSTPTRLGLGKSQILHAPLGALHPASCALPTARLDRPGVAGLVRTGQRLGGRRDCPSSADAAVRRLDGGASRLVPGAVGASSKSASTGSSLPRKSRASDRSLTAPWQPARRPVSKVATSRSVKARSTPAFVLARVFAADGASVAAYVREQQPNAHGPPGHGYCFAARSTTRCLATQPGLRRQRDQVRPLAAARPAARMSLARAGSATKATVRRLCRFVSDSPKNAYVK